MIPMTGVQFERLFNMIKRQRIVKETKRKIEILFIMACAFSCITACQNNSSNQETVQTVSYDSASVGGNLGTAASCEGVLEKMINDSCVKVTGASASAEDVIYTLDSYYYNPDENIVAYGIKVTDLEGNRLSAEKKAEIEKNMSKDTMTISFGSYNEISMYESISDDSDFYISGANLLADKGKAAQDKLDSMTINDGDHEYPLSLPDYSVKSKSVNYKVFTSEELEKCVTGEKTLTLVFDTKYEQSELDDELEQEKKALGDAFNEEDYGYIMYSSIQLKMNDGSLVGILNDKEVGTHVKKQLSGISVSLGLESYQVVLDDSVDLYQVNSVLVDGVEHTVDKTE